MDTDWHVIGIDHLGHFFCSLLIPQLQSMSFADIFCETTVPQNKFKVLYGELDLLAIQYLKIVC